MGTPDRFAVFHSDRNHERASERRLNSANVGPCSVHPQHNATQAGLLFEEAKMYPRVMPFHVIPSP